LEKEAGTTRLLKIIILSKLQNYYCFTICVEKTTIYCTVVIYLVGKQDDPRESEQQLLSVKGSGQADSKSRKKGEGERERERERQIEKEREREKEKERSERL
jgi:hypothetical protein